jgi:C-3',4' desaturase CrtD
VNPPPSPTRPARIEREDLHADVTIIGAGFAGLVAGALLANDGFKVRVLERDIHPGGCAARYERKHALGTFSFAVGATVCAGMEPGGLMQRIYRRVGVQRSLPNLDPVMRLQLNDLFALVPGTRSGWQSELERAFPGQQAQKRAFWRDVGRIADTMHHVARHFPSMPFKSLYDVLDTARGAHIGALEVLLNQRRTVGQLLERHGVHDPAHRAFIDGQLLDSMQVVSSGCALTSGAYALEVYRYGAQYVPGGLATLAEDLAGVIQARGGAVHYATRARRIIVEGGAVRGVETHARSFLSPVVISTAPVPDTIALAGDHTALEEIKAQFNAMPEVWGAFTLYLGVNENALPKDTLPFEQITDFNDKGITENFLVSTSSASDRVRAPAGHRSITISTHVRAKDWFGLEESAYQDKKREFESRILTRLETRFPGITDGIVLLESGTPRTFERFTLHSLGRVGGIPQTTSAAAFGAIHHTTPIKGLLMAGETIFPGQGTLGVSVSGFNAYRTACRLLAARPRTPELSATTTTGTVR